MNDKAKQVVTSVTLVGTLLAGFGLIAPAALLLPPLAHALAIAAVIAAMLAVVGGLGSLLMHFDLAIRPGNIVEVEHWYRLQFRRAYVVVAAGWVLLIAIALAAAATIVTLTGAIPSEALVVLQATSNSSAEVQVSVHTEVTGLDAGQVVQVELIAVSPAGRTMIGQAVGQAAGNGSASITLPAPTAAGANSVEALVSAAERRCTASLPLPPLAGTQEVQ